MNANQNRITRHRSPHKSNPWWATPAAFLATLLALPVSAGVVIPDEPLTTGNRVAPNILFILDDSGSMAFEFMPDSPKSTSTVNVSRQAYTRSSLSYNPAVTYQPWIKADGTRMTGGTSYDKVYGSFNLVGGGTINLSDTGSCRNYNYNTSGNDESNYYDYNEKSYGSSRSYGYNRVCGGVQTFYVPKDPSDSSSFGDGTKYYRYQIRTDGAIIRSWYGARTGSSPNYNQGLSGRGCSTGSGNDWRDCTQVTPTGRSEADERTNYATWFSYHRTRMKAAKAGASEAFAPLSSKVRVGFRTIHGRGANNASPIPVSKGDGRFLDDSANGLSNRSDWYASLHAAIGRSGTPLQDALDKAGQYFSDDAASGAYGPESGTAQLSCRQNFAILTTDGYWNTSTVSLGDQDSTAGPTITGAKSASYSFPAGSPFQDGRTDTLADVAMKYWKNDLRTDDHMGSPSQPDGNNVPASDADPAFWQHMVTFGISIGLSGTSGWTSVAQVKSLPSVSWTDPTDDEDSDRIDDLLHAAVNGHGEFVAATNPKEFTSGLAKALAAISQRTSSFSNVATNAASIRTGGKVFNASYVSGIWTGAVKAWTLDSNNNPSTMAWSASIPDVGSRNVFTSGGSTVTTFPASGQTTALARTGGPANYPVTGAENAAYIKGDSSKEERNGGLLRNRASSVLGDIVNSSPAYVDDTNTLYVGANDGMLHAFDGDTGNELFAYIPGLVKMGDLATLSRGDYTHKWFVDGPIAVTSHKLTPNKNYLIGAMGRGGAGLYGLDVTNPGGFGVGTATWEISGASNANMGMVTSRPVLARVQGGSVAALVGNGVNSTNNKAVLFVVDVATGHVIREIDTGEGDASNPNGLSAPTGILGPDGKTLAYAYAGDRLGNVWKFNMTGAPGTWGVSRLFTAKSADGTGAVQPITGGVTVATDPRTFKRWVFFGTGSYMTTTEANDKTPDSQSMYGFIDDNGAVVSYSDLKKRGFSTTSATQDGYPVRAFDSKAALPSGKKGWFINLPGKGERIVQDAQVISNILLTASMIPEGDACEASGSGYINALDAFTGTSAGNSFFDLDGDGKTDDTTVGGVPVGSVNFGVGMPTLPIILDGKLIVGGTNAGEKPGSGGIVPKAWTRVSWREIRND